MVLMVSEALIQSPSCHLSDLSLFDWKISSQPLGPLLSFPPAITQFTLQVRSIDFIPPLVMFRSLMNSILSQLKHDICDQKLSVLCFHLLIFEDW